MSDTRVFVIFILVVVVVLSAAAAAAAVYYFVSNDQETSEETSKETNAGTNEEVQGCENDEFKYSFINSNGNEDSICKPCKKCDRSKYFFIKNECTANTDTVCEYKPPVDKHDNCADWIQCCPGGTGSGDSITCGLSDCNGTVCPGNWMKENCPKTIFII